MDYYTVEEDYGANDDFHTLVSEAHARRIRVIPFETLSPTQGYVLLL